MINKKGLNTIINKLTEEEKQVILSCDDFGRGKWRIKEDTSIRVQCDLRDKSLLRTASNYLTRLGCAVRREI